MPLPAPPRDRRGFEVALICALPLKASYVQAVFDKFWEDDGKDYRKAHGDPNSYTTGVIGEHNVVLAYMPGTGKVTAATVAATLKFSFPGIRLALVVGICGGVPFGKDKEVILGDIIFSKSVIQYDFGRPSQEIRGVIAKLETYRYREMMQDKISVYLQAVQQKLPEAKYPGSSSDKLFETLYLHKHRYSTSGVTCDQCQKAGRETCRTVRHMTCAELGCNGRLVPRKRIPNLSEEQDAESQVGHLVHFGRIGSGDTVMKSGEQRDRLANSDGIIAFEMEGAGVWDHFPSIIVKGVSDYADSHKNDDWHDNAAATAAAGMKAFLTMWKSGDESNEDQQEEPFSMFPFARNESLIQRQAFDQLAKKLSSSRAYQSAAIWGLGGCGKTQIALEYAYCRQRDTPCSVFWVHGDSEATFSLDYMHIAKKIGLSGELKGEERLQAVRHWIERQKNWLLILDNVDDLRLFIKGFSQPNAGEHSAPSPELFRFVPKCTTGTVLWTSRDKDIVGTLVDVDGGVHIEQMTNQEGLALLRRLSRSPMTEDPSKAELKLLQHLDRLPLAISQAAAYIRKTGESVEAFLRKLESSEERQFRLLDREFIDRHRRSEAPNSVMQTWLISMEQLARDSKDEEIMLRTAAFWDHQGLTFEILQAAIGPDADEDDVSEAVSRLESFSFLQRRRTESADVPTYDMHRLVQLATRNSLNASQKKVFSGQALRIIADVFPDGFYPTWDRSKIYLSHAQKASKWLEAENYGQHVSKLLYNVSSYFYWNGRFNEAVELQLRVLAIRKEIGQGEDPDTLRIMSRLGATYRQLGQFGKGEDLLLQTKDLQKKVIGERHPDTLTTMSYIATLYQHQRRLSEAEELENEVLDLRRAVFPDRHQDTIRSMANLATIYQMQGRYDEAGHLKMQVLEIRKSVLGEEHPETLRTMNNLANSYRAQGRLDEAEELGGRILEIQKRLLGEQHPDTVRSMVSLAETYRTKVRFLEAEQVELEVLKVRKETLGPEHPLTLKSIERLAITYDQQGRPVEAAELHMRL